MRAGRALSSEWRNHPMKLTPVVLAGVAAAAVCLSGCASSSAKRPVYNPNQTGQILNEQRGEIVAVRDVTIKPQDSRGVRGGTGRQVGSAIGMGAITGSVIGAAATIGGVIGGNVGEKWDGTAGEEITIRIDDTDRTIVVVQERGDKPLLIGDRVKVQSGTGTGTSNSIYGSSGGSVKVFRDEEYLAQTTSADARRSAGVSR